MVDKTEQWTVVCIFFALLFVRHENSRNHGKHALGTLLEDWGTKFINDWAKWGKKRRKGTSMRLHYWVSLNEAAHWYVRCWIIDCPSNQRCLSSTACFGCVWNKQVQISLLASVPVKKFGLCCEINHHPPANHAILRSPQVLKICAWGTQIHNFHVWC